MVVFLDNKISFIFLFLINISLKGENIPKISKDDFLKSISNYEILVIGESNHGFGNHIQNRNNFVTELCENYGFDIVCLEGVGILDPIIYGNLLYKEKTKYFNKITNNNLFDVSDTTLLNYFSTRKNKILTGFDNTDVSLYDSLIVLKILGIYLKLSFVYRVKDMLIKLLFFARKTIFQI